MLERAEFRFLFGVLEEKSFQIQDFQNSHLEKP